MDNILNMLYLTQISPLDQKIQKFALIAIMCNEINENFFSNTATESDFRVYSLFS